MTTPRTETLKQEIFTLVREWYDLEHAPGDFTPGETPVPYAGRVSDAEELLLRRGDVTAFLEQRKIATRTLFSGNIVRQPAYADRTYRVFDTLENTDTIMHRTFWIGVFAGLTDDMVDYMLQAIRDFCRNGAARTLTSGVS